MILVPRWFFLGGAVAAACYNVVFGLTSLARGGDPAANLVAVALFVVAFVLSVLGADRMSVPVAAVVAGAGVLLTVLASRGLDPRTASYLDGGWYVGAVSGLVMLLLWRRRGAFAWTLLGALVLQTWAWGGVGTLGALGVTGVTTLVLATAAGGWAVTRTEQHLYAFAHAQRETLEWQAAQDAYHLERQVRLSTTAQLASGMLERIATATESLTWQDRAECRVLEQTIRDEIRGRRLLNDAVRAQVIAHRRRGAVVQVNDDGGLDDLDLDTVEPLLDQVARALDGLTSDLIVIRTAPRDSDTAITVVATSPDPIAVALGTDDGDDQVDLWLELARPALAR